MKKLKFGKISSEEKAYLAGFLDGDGCINAQIIQRPEYRLGFQIRVSITFFQSTKRHWVLLKIQQILSGGSLRKRKDGISEYCFAGPSNVQNVCALLHPYLLVKKKQASLLLQLIPRLTKSQSQSDFLVLCQIADQIGALNDSKKRTNSSSLVQSEWQKLFPVETSKGDSSPTTKGLGSSVSAEELCSSCEETFRDTSSD
jgi:hypothetical protein